MISPHQQDDVPYTRNLLMDIVFIFYNEYNKSSVKFRSTASKATHYAIFYPTRYVVRYTLIV